jgi:hypothetical protein
MKLKGVVGRINLLPTNVDRTPLRVSAPLGILGSALHQNWAVQASRL